jgi:hypothetical protein
MIQKLTVKSTLLSVLLMMIFPLNIAHAESSTSITMSQQMTFEGETGSTSTHSNNSFIAAVGTCAEILDDMCISKVEIKISDSEPWQEMTSKRTNFDELYCAACSLGYMQAVWKRDNRGLPTGDLPSRWMKNNYTVLVQAGIVGSFSEGKELNRPNWESKNTKFNIHGMQIKISSSQISELANANFRITFDIKDRSEAVAGFFDGRLSESHLEITPKNEFVVEGKPVVVTSGTASWSNSQIPDEVIDFFMKHYYKPQTWVGVPSPTSWKTSSTPFGYSFGNGQNRDFPAFDFFEKYFNEKLTKDSYVWSISNLGATWTPTLNKCFVPGKTSGMSTTNANMYTPGIPEWDSVSQTLNFRIASPHKNASGEETRGSYDLTLSESVAKCFWELTSVPQSAELRISYSDGAAEVATVALSSKNGFVYFHAKGFHFSSPSIKIKMNRQKPDVTPSPAVTTSPKTLKTIACKNGKRTIKVLATNPVCPKGYKKVG